VAASRRAELGCTDLVTGIKLPGAGCLALVVQLEWKPIVAFALSVRHERDGIVARLAVGTGFSSVAFSMVSLAHDVEGFSLGTASDVAEALCRALPLPLTDWRASSDYRLHLLKVLMRREIEQIRLGGPDRAN
jgi:CO/xanthine dehydrogenase FAD-binding subunit